MKKFNFGQLWAINIDKQKETMNEVDSLSDLIAKQLTIKNNNNLSLIVSLNKLKIENKINKTKLKTKSSNFGKTITKRIKDINIKTNKNYISYFYNMNIKKNKNIIAFDFNSPSPDDIIKSLHSYKWNKPK